MLERIVAPSLKASQCLKQRAFARDILLQNVREHVSFFFCRGFKAHSTKREKFFRELQQQHCHLVMICRKLKSPSGYP